MPTSSNDPSRACRVGFQGVTTIVGVISDTHDLLRPEATEALTGCSQIIHAGDVGREEVLAALRQIAPVIAVRGNVDRGDWAQFLPAEVRCSIAGVNFYVLHDLQSLNFDPVAAGVDVVISGHSHKPVVERRRDVLYLNPGSAGRRRFTLPVTVAKLAIDAGVVDAKLLTLVV